VIVDDVLQDPLRAGEVLLRERGPRGAELELREEVLRREEALEPEDLVPLRVEDQERRRPRDAEPVEDLGLLLDVDLDRDQLTGEIVGDALIGVDLGIQPSASPSHRGRVEVHEDRAPGCAGARQGRVDVLLPRDRGTGGHGSHLLHPV